MSEALLLLALGVPTLLSLLAIALVVVFCFRRVDQGQALVVSRGIGEPIVSFTRRMVIPVLHHAEVMDITVRTLRVRRAGKDALAFRDGVRADVEALFYLRVNRTAEDVLRVARSLGCARANDLQAIEELFLPHFASALQAAASTLSFDGLKDDPQPLTDAVCERIGTDLDGFMLDSVIVERMERLEPGYRG